MGGVTHGDIEDDTWVILGNIVSFDDDLLSSSWLTTGERG